MASSKLSGLLSQWGRRLHDPHSSDYKCALGECQHELQDVVNGLDNAEIDALDAPVIPTEEEEEHILALRIEEYYREQEDYAASQTI